MKLNAHGFLHVSVYLYSSLVSFSKSDLKKKIEKIIVHVYGKIHEDDKQESCLGNTGISNVSSVTFLYLYRILMTAFRLLDSYSWSAVPSRSSELGRQWALAPHHCSTGHCWARAVWGQYPRFALYINQLVFKRKNLCFTVKTVGIAVSRTQAVGHQRDKTRMVQHGQTTYCGAVSPTRPRRWAGSILPAVIMSYQRIHASSETVK